MKLKKILVLDENQREALKKTQLEILDYFVNFCEKHKLRYYLYAGTLLGAIRHKGYIPWDDDLDLCMPYEDYFKMIELFDNSGKYFVENYYTDHEYFYNFTKIMKKGTIYREYVHQQSKAKQGIFIDIFPIGNVPQKKNLKFLWYYFIVTILNTRSYLKRNKIEQYDCKRTHKHKIIFAIMKVLPWILLWWCPRKFATKLKYSFFKKEWKKKSTIMTTGADFYNRMPWSFFEGVSKVEFEGRMLNAPKNPDPYLKKRYKNYMELPPKKDQIAHHFVCEFKA